MWFNSGATHIEKHTFSQHTETIIYSDNPTHSVVSETLHNSSLGIKSILTHTPTGYKHTITRGALEWRRVLCGEWVGEYQCSSNYASVASICNLRNNTTVRPMYRQTRGFVFPARSSTVFTLWLQQVDLRDESCPVCLERFANRADDICLRECPHPTHVSCWDLILRHCETPVCCVC